MEITIAGRKIEVVQQTQIAFLAYAAIIVSVIVLAMFAPKDSGVGAIMVPTVIIASFLGMYALNCMVVGQCNTFAWIITSLLILEATIMILAVVSILLGFTSSKT